MVPGSIRSSVLQAFGIEKDMLKIYSFALINGTRLLLEGNENWTPAVLKN